MVLESRWDRKLRFWTRDRLTFPFGRSCRRGVILSDIAVLLPQCCCATPKNVGKHLATLGRPHHLLCHSIK